jgi:hypothetical protein
LRIDIKKEKKILFYIAAKQMKKFKLESAYRGYNNLVLLGMIWGTMG